MNYAWLKAIAHKIKEIKDVINIPWELILGLYWRGGPTINLGKANSNRNIMGNPNPIEPPISPVIICTTPI